MKLAKPCIDIGLNTTNGDAMLSFWREEVGLAYTSSGRLPPRGANSDRRVRAFAAGPPLSEGA